ncbi:MAG TPA: NUDIX hydrolase [Actinomycetota bacterium]|nr:NUDIX hydrolase [Actinomycetota bacterium]
MFRGSLIGVDVEQWDDHEREVVRHPGAAAVLTVTAEGSVLFVRQLREALRAPILEIPAGLVEPNEDPADTARRELEEETGYRATELERLGRVYTSPGYSDEVVHLFLATAEPAKTTEEGIELVAMAPEDAVAAVRDGRITDAKSVIALLLAADRLLAGPR